MNSSSKQNSSPIFVTTIDLKLMQKLRQDLLEQGFDLTTPPYTHFQGKKPGVSCTLYQSGKLTVQGKEKDSFLEFYLEPIILGRFDILHPSTSPMPKQQVLEAHMGMDESGKGDFFGPLCIAGVFADRKQILELQKLGVQDSKTLTDKTITLLAKEIRSGFAHHIVRINPKKYNQLYEQFGNLNKLLAWGHATAIQELALHTGCAHVIVDQFAADHRVLTALKRKGIDLNVSQRHHAEEDLVVAAASILARDTFLSGLMSLQEKYGMEFPKGASKKTIAAGQAFVNKFGKQELDNVAKLHFKTTLLVLDLLHN